MASRRRLVALATLLGTAVSAAAGMIDGEAKVVDGDTIEFGPIVVRLSGIDAPEAAQSCATPEGGTWSCGAEAADRMAELIGNATVECEAKDRDAYGRIVAQCWADGVDISDMLAAEGLAWAFVRYSDAYVEPEGRARAAGLGVWQADTETPWEFRANRWQRAADAAPRKGCPIKGNISLKGEKIYHTPWSPWYAKTKISEADGEQWFCDEAEAVAAGWRAARSR